MRLWALFTALTIALFAMATPALAQEEDAREAFRKGEAAYSVGNYELAIKEWNRAYGIDPRPRIQFNLAQAYERIGMWPEASEALKLYLENADPDDPTYADANARRASLQQRLSKTGLILEGGEDGGIIKVDGKEWGRTPRPDKIPVAPGNHQVVVDWGDRPVFQASISVPPGQVVHLTVVTPEKRATAPVTGGTTSMPDAPQPVDNRLSNGMFIGAGAAGALTIGSLVYFINRNSEIKDCGESVACTPDQASDLVSGSGSNDNVTGMLSTQADYDKVQTQRTLGIVGTAVFGAATAGLIVAGFLTRDKGAKADERATSCAFGFTGGTCTVRF